MTAGKSIAVLLAAGEGKRMGMPKALLEYQPGTSFLDRLTTVFSVAGCETLAVIGKDADLVRALHPGLLSIENEEWGRGQFSSVVMGLAKALALGADRVLVCPVDVPTLAIASVEAVLARLNDVEVTIAACDSQPGHPVGLRRTAAAQVLAMADVDNLSFALRRLGARLIATQDAGVLRDFNLPAEYQAHFGHSPKRVERP